MANSPTIVAHNVTGEGKQWKTMEMMSQKMNFHFEEIEHGDIKFFLRKPPYFEA